LTRPCWSPALETGWALFFPSIQTLLAGSRRSPSSSGSSGFPKSGEDFKASGYPGGYSMAAGDFDEMTLCGWTVSTHRVFMQTEQADREDAIRRHAAKGFNHAECAAQVGCALAEVHRVLDGNPIKSPEPMPRMITLPLHRLPNSTPALNIRKPYRQKPVLGWVARRLISCALLIDFHAARRQFLDEHYLRREAGERK